MAVSPRVSGTVKSFVAKKSQKKTHSKSSSKGSSAHSHQSGSPQFGSHQSGPHQSGSPQSGSPHSVSHQSGSHQSGSPHSGSPHSGSPHSVSYQFDPHQSGPHQSGSPHSVSHQSDSRQPTSHQTFSPPLQTQTSPLQTQMSPHQTSYESDETGSVCPDPEPKQIPRWVYQLCSEYDLYIWRIIDTEKTALGLFDPDINGVVQSIETEPDLSNEQEEQQLDANASLRIFSSNCIKESMPFELRNKDVVVKFTSQARMAAKLVSLGWHDETILVFLKLDRRGFDPLFPRSWKPDFPMFPSVLFCPDYWPGGPLIENMNGSEFAAIRAFDTFCKVGQLVRDAKINHTSPARRPAALISRSLRQYLKWAWGDVEELAHDLRHGIVPKLLTIVTGKPGQTPEELGDIITKRLKRMSEKLHEKVGQDIGMNPYPTIFGMVIFESVVGVVAFEPMNMGRDTTRTIGFYHFDRRVEECWNCISLAVLVNCVRRRLRNLQDALLTERVRAIRKHSPVLCETTGQSGASYSPEYVPSSPEFWPKAAKEEEVGVGGDGTPHPSYSPLTPASEVVGDEEMMLDEEVAIKEEPEE